MSLPTKMVLPSAGAANPFVTSTGQSFYCPDGEWIYVPAEMAAIMLCHGWLEVPAAHHYLPDAGGGGLPEAPVDGQTYGRSQAAWQPVVALSDFNEKFPQQMGMSQAANTPGTPSPTYVMQGIHVAIAARGAQGFVIATGTINNDSNGKETAVVLCCGSGAAPANGDAQVGRILTQPARFVASLGGGSFGPFALVAIVQDLMAGTTYWFDLAVKVTGGMGNVSEVGIVAAGLA